MRSEVAQRHNAHFLQAISAADGQLEIGDRDAEDLAEPVLATARVFVVVHVARRVGVFEEQAGTRMIGKYIQYSPVALTRFFVVLHVLVQHAQIQ